MQSDNPFTPAELREMAKSCITEHSSKTPFEQVCNVLLFIAGQVLNKLANEMEASQDAKD